MFIYVDSFLKKFSDANRYRHATKPYDEDTGLYYYTYRHYNPESGRWINRDPIAEEGGLNLYAFCSNNGINIWDLWGNSEGEKGKNKPPTPPTPPSKPKPPSKPTPPTPSKSNKHSFTLSDLGISYNADLYLDPNDFNLFANLISNENGLDFAYNFNLELDKSSNLTFSSNGDFGMEIGVGVDFSFEYDSWSFESKNKFNITEENIKAEGNSRLSYQLNESASVGIEFSYGEKRIEHGGTIPFRIEGGVFFQLKF